MSELDILTQYLKEHNIPFERYDCDKILTLDDDYTFHLDRHQICVPNQRNTLWDVICQEGSLGQKEGLLEACGDIVEIDGEVEGCLTAQDVIRRIEKRGYSMQTISAWLLSNTQGETEMKYNEDLDGE